MQLLTVDRLQPGMLLGLDMVNEQGLPLLAKGSTLTAAYINALRDRGFQVAWVKNGIADDIEPPEILSPELRASAKRHLQELFSLAQAVADADKDPVEATQAFAASARPQMVQIYRDVQKIVDEVSAAEVISSSSRLRNQEGYDFERAVEVSTAAALFGYRLHLDMRDLEGLAMGCLLLDLGNLAVPNEILNKPTRLSPQELEVARRHSEIGYELVRRIVGESAITARHVVRQHHERQDGKGYPLRLRGSNTLEPPGRRRYAQGLIIPAAEIAAVADVYTALASDRPYRPGMTPHQIVVTMCQMAGNHLNRELVARFLTILPAFPVLSHVVVISGKLKDYRGVVARINPRDVHHPTVRILFDSRGHEISPFEVDTGKDKGVEIALLSPTQPVAASA